MATLQNDENDMPIEVNNPRPLKVSRQTYKVLADSSRVDKRPRGLKPQTTVTATTRRAVLGDVTNKVNIKKSSMSSSMGFGLQQKKLKTTSINTGSINSSSSSSIGIAASTTTTSKVVKRTYTGQAVVSTTPVVNTFGSLVLGDKPSPLCGGSALSGLDTIKEDSPAKVSHDIDSEDKQDASACWQYAEDLTKYHLETEKERMTSPSFMARQTDVNSKMRSILIDWLVDVHSKYTLQAQTLHIAIHLIDRHLEKNVSVPRQRLQLVGVTALFVASKYEEIYPPEADDFVKITDNAYTREELFAMEVDLLMSVGYRVTFPTAYQFMKRFLKASRTCDDRVEHFAHYVIDKSLQDYKLVKHAPSRIAAAAVHIARTQMNDLPAWNATLEHHSTYSENGLQDVIEDLKEMLWNAQNGVGKASKLSAVRRKFEKERFMGVASHPLVFDDAL